MTLRVALVTCAELPELDPDDRALLGPLRARGAVGEAAAWDDPNVDWSAPDLVVLRSTWDYTRRREEFLAWAAAVPRLLNPAPLVAWNTDKRYLLELAAAGVPVVPSVVVEPGEVVADAVGEEGRLVVKPTVGLGSLDVAVHDLRTVVGRRAALAHATRLAAAGGALVQPYLPGVEEAGETAVVVLGGRVSHAARKGPMLAVGGRADDESGLYVRETITPRTPSPAELDVARAALAAVPPGLGAPAYARVDLVPGADGEPLLLELELTEPSLFLAQAPGGVERFADVLVAAAGSGRR